MVSKSLATVASNHSGAFQSKGKNHPNNANKEVAGSKSFGLTFPFSFGGYINSIHTYIYIYIHM